MRLNPPLGDTPLGLQTVSEVWAFGHSHMGAIGATSLEYAWIGRLAKALDADLFTRFVDGAIALHDDLNATGDGGWNRAWNYLDSRRAAGPFIAEAPLVALQYGHNDVAQYNDTSDVLNRMKHAIRGIIAMARCGVIYRHDNATRVRLSGGVGANWDGSDWVALGTGTADRIYYLDGGLKYCLVAGPKIELTLPADYPGTPVWLFTMSGGDGSGAAFSATVDGGATTPFPSSADTRNLQPPGAVPGRIAGQAWQLGPFSPGAHTIIVTIGTMTTAFYFSHFGVEPEIPTTVLLPQLFRAPSYEAYAGWPFPLDDAAINNARTVVQELAQEFDRFVVSGDADALFNKQSKYFHTDNVHLNDLGHEVFATKMLEALDWKAPSDARAAIVLAQKRSDPSFSSPWKISARARYIGNINRDAPPATADGVTLKFGDKVLLADQTTKAQNGLYTFHNPGVPLDRADDANTSDRLKHGVVAYVYEGALFGDSLWSLSTGPPITIETTGLTFRRIGAPVVRQLNLVDSFSYQIGTTATTATTLTRTALGTTTARIFPFRVEAFIATHRIIVSTPTSVTTAQFAIYNESGTRVWHGTGTTTAGLTVYTPSPAPLDLDIGTYYFAVSTTATGTETFVLVTPALSSASLARWGTIAVTAGALPTSITTSGITETVGGFPVYVTLSEWTT